MNCVGNVSSLLSSVLRWLENEDDDEKWWQLQTQVAQLCLLELELVFRPEPKPKPGKVAPLAIPGTEIVPFVHRMVSAMQCRNRALALESGKHALEQLTSLE